MHCHAPARALRVHRLEDPGLTREKTLVDETNRKPIELELLCIRTRLAHDLHDRAATDFGAFTTLG